MNPFWLVLPGGVVQKYSYQFGTSPTCQKKAQYTIHTVRNRITRQTGTTIWNVSSSRCTNVRMMWLFFQFVWSCVNTALMTGVGGSWRLYRVYLNSCKQVLFKLQHMYFPEKVTHAFYVGEGDKGVNLVNNWQVEINCLCHVYGPVTVLCFKGKRNSKIWSKKYIIYSTHPFCLQHPFWGQQSTFGHPGEVFPPPSQLLYPSPTPENRRDTNTTSSQDVSH